MPGPLFFLNRPEWDRFNIQFEQLLSYIFSIFSPQLKKSLNQIYKCIQTYWLWLEELQFKFKRKIRTWTGIWTSDLQIGALPLELTWFNWRYKSKSPSWKQCYSGVVVCDTICHDLTNELTSYYLFIVIFLNQIYKLIQTYSLCLEELQFKFRRKIVLLN